MPPISAWWPRDATQNRISPLRLLVEHRRADRDVGQVRAAIVGRVDREHVARADLALVLADDGLDRRSIEPRCTGMCGALATSEPSASNTAQEKSSRSLILTE